MATALLQGKFAVVTGAASKRGLGKATAKLFAEHGATVAILDLDEAAAKEAAADLGPQHVGMACDVTDLDGVKAVMDKLAATWGAIDILVNNAGITQPLKIMEIAPKNYDAVLDVNLRGTLYCSQAVIPHMRSRKEGKIVNLSSVSAQRGGGVFGKVPYSAAKAAILGFTKALAREIADSGVTVNSVTPGAADTNIRVGATPESEARLAADIPIGRVATTDEIAAVFTFLSSRDAAYLQGTNIDINGASHLH